MMSAYKTVRGLTIDDASTRDIDDAIWVEETANWWDVTISIADVSGVVLERDVHDLRARQMVETKYFAAGNSPMLDRRLSEDELSLWPDRKRSVIAVSIIVDKATLSNRDVRISLASLTSVEKLTYGDIPEILGPLRQEHVLPMHRTMITSAASLSRALLDKRRLDGAFVLYDLNNGWITTEEGFLRQVESHEATVGHIIVQELMILANSAVARWAVDHDIPILFRNHEARSAAPDRAELQRQLDGALSMPMQNIDLLRQRTHLLLDRASYGSSVLGHYGLNLPVYTHFTSPIRRYADLVNHRQIRNALHRLNPQEPVLGGDHFYTKNQITEFADHINSVLKAEDVARSQAMKQKHERKAVRAIDARRLDGLPHKEFERVTKIEARSGEDPSAAFLDAFTLRTRESKTSLLAMAVVLTQAPTTDAWRPIRGVIVEALARRPEDAVSVLAQAPQISERWGIPRYELVAGVEFEAAAWVRVDGTTSMGKASAKQKKRAEQLAAVALLAGLSGVPVPDAISPVAPATPTALPAPVAPTLNPAKDPISTLQEWGQLHDASPGYLFDIHGPPHAPVVTCTCRVVIKRGEREFLARAEAGNKATAKRAAAVEMILVLATERQ